MGLLHYWTFSRAQRAQRSSNFSCKVFTSQKIVFWTTKGTKAHKRPPQKLFLISLILKLDKILIQNCQMRNTWQRRHKAHGVLIISLLQLCGLCVSFVNSVSKSILTSSKLGYPYSVVNSWKWIDCSCLAFGLFCASREPFPVNRGPIASCTMDFIC